MIDRQTDRQTGSLMSTQSFSASALLTLGLDESQMRGVLGPASLVSIPPGVTINNVSRLCQVSTAGSIAPRSEAPTWSKTAQSNFLW